PAAAFAQNPPPTPEPDPPAVSAPVVELDQTVVNVQTTMPLNRHKSYFKITHRFARDLRRGSFGQLAEDAFSLDNGAIIGLEYRFAFTDTLQAGIHRSILGKTIQTFAKWDVRRQSEGAPFGLALGASIEGQNNLHLDRQPGRDGGARRQPARRLHGLQLEPEILNVADLNASAVGLAVVLALTFALYILRQEENSDETLGNSSHGSGNRRGGLRK